MTMMSALFGCVMGRSFPGLFCFGIQDRYIEENWKVELKSAFLSFSSSFSGVSCL